MKFWKKKHQKPSLCYDSVIRSEQTKNQIKINNYIKECGKDQLKLFQRYKIRNMKLAKRENLRTLRVLRFEVEDRIAFLGGFKNA